MLAQIWTYVQSERDVNTVNTSSFKVQAGISHPFMTDETGQVLPHLSSDPCESVGIHSQLNQAALDCTEEVCHPGADVYPVLPTRVTRC